MKKIQQYNGFSIVELMVVIVVVAILATIGYVGYENLQKDVRDKERQSDIELIQAALETYYSQKGHYPGTNNNPADIKSLMEEILSVPRTAHQVPAASNPHGTSVKLTVADPVSPEFYSYGPQSCTTSECQKYQLKWKSEKTNTVTTIQSRYGW